MIFKEEIGFQRIVRSISSIKELCDEYDDYVLVFVKTTLNTKSNEGLYQCVIYYKGHTVKFQNTLATSSFDRLILEAFKEALHHLKDGYSIMLVTSTDVAFYKRFDYFGPNCDISNDIIIKIKDMKSIFCECYLDRNSDMLYKYVTVFFVEEDKNALFNDDIPVRHVNVEVKKYKTSGKNVAKRISGKRVHSTYEMSQYDCFVYVQRDGMFFKFIPNKGYFYLLSEILKKDEIISHQYVVENQEVFMEETFIRTFVGLSDKEIAIIRNRYGLGDGKRKTLEQIGNTFGVTRERIRQIELKALRKLRYKSRVEICESILEDTEERSFEYCKSSCPVIWLNLSGSIIKFMKRQNILSENEMKQYILKNPEDEYSKEFQTIFERIHVL